MKQVFTHLAAKWYIFGNEGVMDVQRMGKLNLTLQTSREILILGKGSDLNEAADDKHNNSNNCDHAC